jgi:hypothetical protein
MSDCWCARKLRRRGFPTGRLTKGIIRFRSFWLTRPMPPISPARPARRSMSCGAIRCITRVTAASWPTWCTGNGRNSGWRWGRSRRLSNNGSRPEVSWPVVSCRSPITRVMVSGGRPTAEESPLVQPGRCGTPASQNTYWTKPLRGSSVTRSTLTPTGHMPLAVDACRLGLV